MIVNVYKEKGDALDQSNCKGFKLLDHVMKVMARVLEGMFRERVNIDEIDFDFMPGRGTTDAIFIDTLIGSYRKSN